MAFYYTRNNQYRARDYEDLYWLPEQFYERNQLQNFKSAHGERHGLDKDPKIVFAFDDTVENSDDEQSENGDEIEEWDKSKGNFTIPIGHSDP